MMNRSIFPHLLVMFMLLAWSAWRPAGPAGAQPAPTCYYVAPEGDDAEDGLAPGRAWRSLERVNAARLAPGDKVLFRRGGQWRGQLVPQSGGEAGPVTYGAFGSGPKPALLGSAAFARPEDWRRIGPNLWLTNVLPSRGANLLGAELPGRWQLHCEQGAAARGRSEEGSGYTVACTKPGTSGSHLQLYLAPFRIQKDTVYRLRWRARASASCTVAAPRLMAAAAPWGGYAADTALGRFTVDGDWTACEQLYRADRDADDARLTFFLGGVLPGGAELTLADLELFECEGPDRLPLDVGNIIFDHGRAWGGKKWSARDLQNDLDYWYDGQRHAVMLRSAVNPARRFQSVELALRRHIIDQSGCGYVVFDRLGLRYGAAHGIGGGGTHHITVRDCDICWIGGGHQLTRPDGKPVRFGNGVEFWGNAHDNLVENCRLWEIYDAALTNQNQGATVLQHRITYRDNRIWNCEYSFEYWNRPAASETRDIVFERNRCFGAGFGWGHAQRPDPCGRHLCFYASGARMSAMAIRDNVFSAATDVSFDALWWTPQALADRRAIRLDGNLWHQPQGTLARLQGKVYAPAEFAAYQRDTGQDTGSWLAQALPPLE